MKIPIILQARVGSSRLPSKVLKKILGKPMLYYIVERLKLAKESFVVLAIPDTSQDDVLCKLAKEYGVPCIKGSEKNVLSRYFKVSQVFDSDFYIRATADNPLVDYDSANRLIDFVKNNKDIDYACEKELPYGAAVELFSKKALTAAYEKAESDEDKEHVTLYIKNNPKLFRIVFLEPPLKLRHPELRVTVDYEKDFLFIKKIYEKYYKGSPISLSEYIEKIIEEVKDEKK